MSFGFAFAQTPIEIALQSHDKARNEGRFAEASSSREEAVRLLSSASPEASQFRNWTLQVASLFGNLGYTERARSILTSSLARLSTPSTDLLGAIADSWWDDGNLLASLKYREQALAAPAFEPSRPASFAVVNGAHWFHYRGGDSKIFQQQRLAALYLELGRPDAAAAITEKIGNPFGMAQLYEREGSVDRAIAIYEQSLARAEDIPFAAESLSRILRDQQKNTESIAVLEKAIASVPGDQAAILRETLAGALQTAGRTEASEEIYRSLIRENPDDFGIVSRYANQTADPKQAEAALNAFRDSHLKMEWWQQSSILNSLATVARKQGDSERADEYQRAFEEHQRTHIAQTQPQLTIAAEIQKANGAANAGRLDEAVEWATQAVDRSARAVDRQQILWTVHSIAERTGSAALESRLFGVVRSWDEQGSLITLMENHARALLRDRKRSAELPSAIEQMKAVVIAAHGANSSSAGNVLRLKIDWERSRGDLKAALSDSQDLADFEKSIAGDSSEPYVSALEGLAQSYEAIGDHGRQIDALRQAIAIADKANLEPFRKGRLRANAAMALAALGKFDEAEQLAAEAVAIGEKVHQPQAFATQVSQIQRMKNNHP